METKKTIEQYNSFVLSNMSVKALVNCLALTLLFGISSCSKIVDNIEEKNSTESILVEESPWVFSRYETSFVEDDGGSGLSSKEIENDMDQFSAGISFTFNSDGTGFIDIPEQGQDTWVWTLTENQLKTVSNTQTDRYTFFSADRNQMTFESRTTTIHIRNSVQYNVTHVGKYIFN